MSFLRLKQRKLFLVFLAALLVGTWYFLRTPSNTREWSPDQNVLAYAEFNNDSVTIFNIRNFTYTSIDEYAPAYYTKTFNVNSLKSVDYIVEPFGNIGAAHTFLSFGFENGDYVAISVEIRKEIDELFSPLKGLLRNYELMYVIADERDAVKLRTNYRKDTVYLYPVTTSKENIQRLFTDMLTRANTLRAQPEFYNTLTNTCTTNIADHINNISPKRIPWDLRLLFPENSDALAYELGLIDTSMPIDDLRSQHKINARAELYAESPDFSKLIRQ